MAKAWWCTLVLGVALSGVVNASAPQAASAAPVPVVVDIASGGRSTCALTGDHRIFCWGSDAYGGLGDGSSTDSATPVQVTTAGTPLEGRDVADVEVGGDRACALTTDGVLACWGDNYFRELGTGTSTSSSVPVAVNTAGTPLAGKAWAQVSLAYQHSCAVTTDGIVACWGASGNGQAGTTSPGPSVPTAILTTGTVLDGKSVARVAAGKAHTCVLTTDGIVACWGSNASGQLGNSSNDQSVSAVAVTTAGTPLASKTVVGITAGDDHTCARTADGKAACWGGNSVGQLGNGSSTSSSKPVAVTTSGVLSGKSVAQIDAGNAHTCAVTTDGTAACWGENGEGALGNGSTAFSDSATPTAVVTVGTPLDGKPIAQISSRTDTTCARTTDGTGACWGSRLFGQRGDGQTGIALVPAPAVTGSLAGKVVTQLAAGRSFACGLTGGKISCWGIDARFALPAASAVPLELNMSGTPFAAKSFSRIEADNATLCGLTTDGLAGCWTVSPVLTSNWVSTTDPVLSGKVVTSLAVGANHVCVGASDGTLACRGSNSDGQLGNGTTTFSLESTPVVTSGTPLEGKTVASLTAGWAHTCARATDSTLACWGNGELGIIGRGSNHSDALVPAAVTTAGTPLAGKTVAALEAGNYHTCALTSDGVVACWGDNGAGQAGAGTSGSTQVPTAMQVAGTPLSGKVVSSLAAGGRVTCATTTVTTAACAGGEFAGTGTYYRLGSGGPLERSLTPVELAAAGTPLAGKVLRQVAVAGDYACGLSTDGVASCWGSNQRAVFGNGTLPRSSLAAAIAWDEVPLLPPTSPAIGAVVAGDGQVSVSWSAPVSDGGSAITGYVVTPYVGGVAQSPVPSSGTGTSKVVTGLANGTAYTFKVAAVNAVGTGPQSVASASVTPVAPATVPGAPAIGAVVAGDGQVSVSWSAPVSDGGSAITGYVVTPYVGGVAQSPVPSSGTGTSKVVTGLANGTAYTFKVAAVNAVGTGPQSVASASVTPLPPYAPFASWTALVQRLHTDLTNVAPSASALSTWTTALGDGTKTKGDLVQALRESTDNTSRVDPTVRLYRALLGRAPDAGGLKFWVARRRTGSWTLVRMADYFASSSEFKRKYGALTNEQFVRRIYTDVLGRTADEAGVDYWTRQLDLKRRTRGSVMVGFSESNEYKTKQRENTDVAVAYIFLLGRAPTTGETTDWVTREKAGTTQAVLAAELLDSTGYATHITG